MKRILQIVGSMDRGGAETMVMNLYRAIDKSKYQFDFVYFTAKDPCDYDEEILSLGGRIFRIPISNPIKRIAALRKLLRVHPEWQTVHSHTLFANAFNLYAAYKEGVPQRIAHSHNTANQSKNKWIGEMYQNWARKMIVRYATHFVACGSAASKFLFPNQKEVLLLPNAINVDNFAQIAQTHKYYLRQAYHLGEETLIILQLGRLNKVKNHKFSIGVADALKSRGIDFRMLFVGQGSLDTELKQKVKSLGLEQDVLFLGLRTDIAELLAGVDIMIMPSFHEGFPVVMVEAQAAGLPCLLSDTISSEVDLGIGLVSFLSLNDNIQAWVNKLQILNQSSFSAHSDDKLNCIKAQGFDISSNARQIQKLYS